MSGNTSSADMFQWPYSLSPYDSGMVIEDTWPTLFWGAERLDEIRRKVENFSWAANAVAQMRQEAESVLDEPPLLPQERIGWRHDFYSHKTAEHLRYDPKSPHRFLVPLDQSYEEDELQHRAWALLTHERSYRIMRSLGVLYGLTGDERYAEWIAQGMRRTVEFFSRTDLREGNHYDALYFSALYDAPEMMLLANAYSLTQESRAYSDADHKAIKAGIFEAGVSTLIRYLERSGTHNITTYVMAGMAACGDMFGHSDWVDIGLGRVPALFREGLRTDAQGRVDGYWFEGTMFYHFYTLCPLAGLFEMLRRKGRLEDDLTNRFKKMFEAPVQMCDQDLRLPCLGDLGAPGSRSLAIYRHLYEYAAGQLDSDLAHRVLRAIYGRGIPRNNLSALAYGPDDVTAEPISQKKSTVLTAMGIGVFREETGDGPFYLLFKGGPHGAGHDHPDKLSVDLRAMGELIAPDLGTAGYALRDIHAYYRSTLSHNTLMVDEQDQQRAEKAHLQFQEKDPRHASAVVEDAYEGVRLSRRIRFEPPHIWIEDQCASDAVHRYGWVFHARGGMIVRPSGVIEDLDFPPLSQYGVFAWLTNRRTVSVDGVVCVDWRISNQVWLRLLAASDGPFEVTSGQTPGNPMPDRRGTVYLRARGKSRIFRAAFEVHRGAPGLTALAAGDFEW